MKNRVALMASLVCFLASVLPGAAATPAPSKPRMTPGLEVNMALSFAMQMCPPAGAKYPMDYVVWVMPSNKLKYYAPIGTMDYSAVMETKQFGCLDGVRKAGYQELK